MDPVRKPHCPGPKFPWSRLYEALKTKEAKVVNKDVKVTVKVNGKKIEGGVLDAGVTYLPVKAIAQALGLTVGWDQASKTVTLTKGAK
ncbi:hypothetical protein D3C75_1014490 [compost metagenome]